MSDISLADKINLKNKFLDKINKNINQVNNSLDLLNNFNHKMNRQYGGALDPLYSKIHDDIDANTSTVTAMIVSSEEQIRQLNLATEETLKQLIAAQAELAKININNAQPKVDTSQIYNQLTKILSEIKPQPHPQP
jgi:hypothetical protein